MNRISIAFLILSAALLPVWSAADVGAYLDNPLGDWLLRQSFEARLELQVNTDGNENPPAAYLAGVGLAATEAVSVGLYGLLRESDRVLPRRMRRMYGFGVYAERQWQAIGAWIPFLGGRIGLLDPTGPGYGTAWHAGGQLGARLPLSARASLSLGVGLQWAEDDLFNYRASSDGTRYRADNTDFTFDFGIHFGF